MEEQKFNLMKIAAKLKKYLDEDRLWHTLGVMQMSASLAIRYDYPMERAQLAGLLHDCAKCIPAKKKLKICKENKIPVTDFEREHTFLLHAKVGAWVAREKYGVTDPDFKRHHLAYHRKRRYDASGKDHIYRGLYRAGKKQSTKAP